NRNTKGQEMVRLNMRKWLVWLCMISILLAGCGQQAPQNNEGSKSNELVLALGSESDEGFDPTTGWGRYGSPLFQSTLLTYDHELQIVNDLATAYETNEDGTVWTVTLRDDVLFSDGEPLTSADVQYTFETAASSGSVVDLQILDQVEAVDEHTVRFQLKEPQSTFIHALVATGIVPQHAHGPDYSKEPIGSGPYELVQWDR